MFLNNMINYVITLAGLVCLTNGVQAQNYTLDMYYIKMINSANTTQLETSANTSLPNSTANSTQPDSTANSTQPDSSANTTQPDSSVDSALPDSPEARNLFGQADVDGNGLLTLPELHGIFQAFDRNKNGIVTYGEFISKWRRNKLGPVAQGQTVFSNIDFNQDGFIDETNDVVGFYHFDTDGDSFITEEEFVIGWLTGYL